MVILVKKMRKSRNSGQNLMEAAILFAIVVGVVASMQTYLQRSFQARYKAGADYVHREIVKAAPALAGTPRQYDPYYAQSWQEDNKTFDTLAGYPNSAVNDTQTSKAWALTDVPWQIDN